MFLAIIILKYESERTEECIKRFNHSSATIFLQLPQKTTMNGSRSLDNSSDILLREKKSFYTVVVTRTTEEVFEN